MSMYRQIKKYAAVLLAALFFSCLGFACGRSDENPASVSDPTEASSGNSLSDQSSESAPQIPDPVPEGRLAFDKRNYGVGVGMTLQTSVSGENVGEISYNSSAPDVASVGADGKVTAIKEGIAEITASALSNGSNTEIEAVCRVTVNSGKYTSLSGEETLIKWTGRNFFLDGGVNCYNTASGFEVNFYGTELRAEITAAGNKTPRICVLIDGSSDPAEQVIGLSKTKETTFYTLAENLSEGEHSVRVYKITEAYTTSLAFSEISTDGYFTDRPEDRSCKIEIYGDSITVGHNNLRGTPEENDSDNMQNGCLTYAWLAAEEFGADIRCMARTGIGLYCAWGNPFVLENNWKKTYLAENDFLHSPSVNPEWSDDGYRPDAVLVNIGTNDVWFDWADGGARYKKKMKKFCEELWTRYGRDTEIILLYGMMTAGNEASLRSVSDELSGNGKNIVCRKLPASEANHPRVADHRAAAAELLKVLRERLKAR